MRGRCWRAALLGGISVLGAVLPASADASPRGPVVRPVVPAPAPAVPTVAAPRPVKVWRPRRVAAPTPFIPPAVLALHVTPGALGTPWTLEVTNVDSMPLRFVTDSRLLTLDVKKVPDTESGRVRAATVHCALPSELRPVDDDHAWVLLPSVTYVETFDPRLYCFDAHDSASLVPGAEVVARLGWPGAGASPPFIADGIDGGDPRAGVKELSAVPVIVPDELVDDEDDQDRSVLGLRVSSPARIDTETGRRLAVSVTVENTTSRPVRLLLRPETIHLHVSSTRGVHDCAWRTHPGAPIAEVFTTIPAHGKSSTDVLASAICPDGTLDAAGLYTILASIDTRGASGRSIGIQTFDDRVVAQKPSIVRVRRDRAPRP